MITRTNIINKLIKDSQHHRYLEIGIGNNENFNNIICNHKESVDPAIGQYSAAAPTYKLSSNDFFNIQLPDTKWDIIFIDGLHEYEQVYKDLTNSIKHLAPNGHIVCHDMNPILEEHQAVPRVSKCWNGDCWKAWVKLRTENTEFNMYVLNTDNGCGVLTRSEAPTVKLDIELSELTYNNLEQNRIEWLNLINV